MTQCCPGFRQINRRAPAVLMGTGWWKVQLVGVAKTTGARPRIWGLLWPWACGAKPSKHSTVFAKLE